MILRNRALFVFTACVSAALIGCSGGGGGGGGGRVVPTTAPTATPTSTATTPSPTPTATATAKPTATPVPTATPKPTATPTPFPTASAATVYSGTSTETFVYYGSTPNPSGTIVTSIQRGVTDEGSTTFNGATTDRSQSVDTDYSANQTVTVTTNTYTAQSAVGAGVTGVYDYGYASLASSGQSITVDAKDVPASNGLTDELPETSGQAWKNDGAQTLSESDADGFTATRTVSAGGAYVENDLTPQNSQASPQPSPLPATITANSDFSGSYVFYYGGESAGSSSTFTFAAPSGGDITITADSPAFGIDQTFTVTQWWSTSSLYTESDADDGAQTIPAACKVPAAYGTSGNRIDRDVTSVDPVLGTLETVTTQTYDVNDFPVCVTANDLVVSYYDYTGQSGEAPFGIGFSSTPLERDTTVTTIGLQKTSVAGAARRSQALSSMRAAVAGVVAATERRSLERRHRAALHFRSLFLGRLHR